MEMNIKAFIPLNETKPGDCVARKGALFLVTTARNDSHVNLVNLQSGDIVPVYQTEKVFVLPVRVTY